MTRKTRQAPKDRDGVRYVLCEGGGPWAGMHLAFYYPVKKDGAGGAIKPPIREVAPAILTAKDEPGRYLLEVHHGGAATYVWRAQIELREAA